MFALLVALTLAQSGDPTGGWASSDPAGTAPPGGADPARGATPTKDAAPAGRDGADGTPKPAEGDGALAAGAETRTGAAGERGIVIRLEAPTLTGKTVTAVLTPDTGKPTTVPLKDDGRPPDVSGGDGLWSGSVWIAGDRFTVEVTADKQKWKAGPVAWDASATKRDLALAIDGATLTATATTPPEGPPPDEANPAPGGGALSPAELPAGAPPVDGGPTSGASGKTPGVGAPFPQSQNPSTFWMLLFAGGVALVAVGWSLLRGRRARGGVPGSVTRMPEPGVLGPGSPSLSDGASVWVVPEADLPQALGGLLATVAAQHRVLVAAPPAMVLPLVRGGPVYRVPFLKAGRFGDTADAMVDQPGQPLALIVVGQGIDAAAIRAIPEHLPEGVGAIVLTSTRPETPLPTVELVHDADGWRLHTPTATLRVVEGPGGFSRG